MDCLPYVEPEEEKIENLARCPWNKFVCLEQECQDFLNSGKYYVTPEIFEKVRCIERAVNSLKLAYTLFKKKQSCSTSLHSGDICENELLASVIRCRDQFERIRRRMNKCKLHQALDLELRQAYHFTMQDLLSIEQVLAAHVRVATHNLNEYCANLGVTDRFSGFRNNLSQPFNDPLLSTPPKVSQSLILERSRKNVFCNETEERCKPISLRSIQEQFGIMVDFPGSTEYTDSFKLPEKHRLFPYVINPTPNYNVGGRKMAKRLEEPLCTNYSINFQWPDANKLPMFPWMRK